MRHQYGFAMTPERIVRESLLVYRTSKPQQWFARQLRDDGETYDYEFSTHLTGPRKLWQESTRSTLHLAELFRLADQAGLLSNPEMATRRMKTLLALRGIEA